VSAVTAQFHPRTVVARETVRRSLRSGLLWGVVFGVYIALQAYGYASAYKTPAQRETLATSFSSGGLTALMGPGHQLQNVAGYTAWKSLAVLTIIGAIWGILIATKLLRGEEDAGRWELLIAGQTTPRRAAAQVLLALSVALAAMFAVTAVITVAVGRGSTTTWPVGSALFFAVSMVCGAAMFLAAGALASQLATTRRQAAAFTGALFGICFAIRAVADSAHGLGWLRWASPLGWIETLQPFADPRPLALLPIAALTLALSGLAVRLAGQRDVGTGTLRDRADGRFNARLLTGPIGLTVRLVRPSVIGWLIAVAAEALLIGSVTKQAVKSLQDTSGAGQALIRLGGSGVQAKSYLAISFLIVAMLVMAVATGQVTAARHEESSGHLDHVLVRPVSRTTWLAGKLAVAVAVVIAAGVTAGVFSWLGTAANETGIGMTSLLGAGLNTVPPALCLLGIGTLTLGLWPRAASAVMYAVIAWSFLVELLAGIVGSSRWLLDTSLLHQMTAAPARAPDLTSATVLVAVGVLTAFGGGVALTRRDLAGD